MQKFIVSICFILVIISSVQGGIWDAVVDPGAYAKGALKAGDKDASHAPSQAPRAPSTKRPSDAAKKAENAKKAAAKKAAAEKRAAAEKAAAEKKTAAKKAAAEKAAAEKAAAEKKAAAKKEAAAEQKEHEIEAANKKAEETAAKKKQEAKEKADAKAKTEKDKAAAKGKEANEEKIAAAKKLAEQKAARKAEIEAHKLKGLQLSLEGTFGKMVSRMLSSKVLGSRDYESQLKIWGMMSKTGSAAKYLLGLGMIGYTGYTIYGMIEEIKETNKLNAEANNPKISPLDDSGAPVWDSSEGLWVDKNTRQPRVPWILYNGYDLSGSDTVPYTDGLMKFQANT